MEKCSFDAPPSEWSLPHVLHGSGSGYLRHRAIFSDADKFIRLRKIG
jgi:hypothetical protein